MCASPCHYQDLRGCWQGDGHNAYVIITGALRSAFSDVAFVALIAVNYVRGSFLPLRLWPTWLYARPL